VAGLDDAIARARTEHAAETGYGSGKAEQVAWGLAGMAAGETFEHA
jgi:hypothetical protein